MSRTVQKTIHYCMTLIIAVLLSACSYINSHVDTNHTNHTSGGTFDNHQQHIPQPSPIDSQQLTSIPENKHYKIALFLPIKSSSVPIKTAALSLLNAARLAHQEINTKNMDLIVYPIDDTNETIIPAAERAVQDKVDLVIGPLLSPSVVTTRRYTEAAGIPMIALSNDQTAVNGGLSYLLSYLPEQNIANIVDYAFSQGHKDFGLFASNTPYGKRVGDTLIQEVNSRNGNVTKSVYFTENSADFYEKAKEVTEFDSRLSAETPTSWTSILLPDRATLMMHALPLLSRYNVNLKKSLLLGTGIWDDPRILEVEELDGAVFAAPNRTTLNIFETRYQEAYKEKPTTIASLGYDAVALVAGLIKRYPNNPFDIANITNPNGFTGVGGIFRFRKDGLSERGLSILRIQNKRFNLVIPAPDTFSGS